MKNKDDFKRFSVSLVYQNIKLTTLRTLIATANSEEEAIGITIEYFDKETNGLGLILQSATKIN